MGNLFDIAKIDRRSFQGIQIIRREKVKREGSPFYPWLPGSIAASAILAIYLPDYFPTSRKYQPLDYFQIVNNDSACDLNLIINGKDTFSIPQGTIQTFRGFGLWHIQLTNLNAVTATTAGATRLTFQKEPLTIDQWARRQD